YGATGYSASARASILGAAAQNWTDSAQGSYLAFGTTPNGSTTLAERMRIDQSGFVGIGNTSPAAMLDIAAVTGGSVKAINTTQTPGGTLSGNPFNFLNLIVVQSDNA